MMWSLMSMESIVKTCTGGAFSTPCQLMYFWIKTKSSSRKSKTNNYSAKKSVKQEQRHFERVVQFRAKKQVLCCVSEERLSDCQQATCAPQNYVIFI